VVVPTFLFGFSHKHTLAASPELRFHNMGNTSNPVITNKNEHFYSQHYYLGTEINKIPLYGLTTGRCFTLLCPVKCISVSYQIATGCMNFCVVAFYVLT
jgi:hypothetical protein